ncbi:MAG: NAD-dependent dehydratase, partial [Pseudomonadota bacterium]
PRSKWRAEARARALAEELGLETAILLPSAPIGAEDHRLTPPSKMLLDLANGALPATLDCRLNLVAAEAVAEGIAAAVGGPAVGWGRPWRRFLLTGEDLEMDDYLALVGRVSGVAPPRAKAPYLVALAAAQVEARISALTGRAPSAPLTGVRLAGPKLRFDAGRAGAELGFAPPPLETALRAALGWMREAGLTRRPLPGLGA